MPALVTQLDNVTNVVVSTPLAANSVGAAGTTSLVGQVVRSANPVAVNSAPILPSYSQAISQTTTAVRAIRPAGHFSGASPGLVSVTARRSVEGGVSVNGAATGQRFSLTVPALSALLAGWLSCRH